MMAANPIRDGGSFRDPAGHVYRLGKRVLRTVSNDWAENYEFVRDSAVFPRWVESGRVISACEINLDKSFAADARYVLEHPAIPVLSYPYEWSFSGLRAAALLHLDLMLEGLEFGLTLTDASPYNIQFKGAAPQLIDVLSFRRYREGEYWTGHRQFCEQFLAPLMLMSSRGIPFHAWLRGSPEGIPLADVVRLLRWKSWIDWRVLTHVILPNFFQVRTELLGSGKERIGARRPLPRVAYRSMVSGIRTWIEGLPMPALRHQSWLKYGKTHTYSIDEIGVKEDFVRSFINDVRPQVLLDFGCNTGRYAEIALENGAASVVGFDADPITVDAAYILASKKGLNFLPLYLDAADPSPGQGWRGIERKSLQERLAGADGVLALAFVHHLVIGRNIPLAEVVDWLIDLAPHGVIEFVSKADPTVQVMLRDREDIFDNYTLDAFLKYIIERADIVCQTHVGDGMRTLIRYCKRGGGNCGGAAISTSGVSAI